MRTRIGLTAILLMTAGLHAQQIPPGTLLPTMLNNTLNSDKTKPGEEISAKLMQDVPLPDGGKIKRGSKVLGHVVTVTPASAGTPSHLVVQFDRIELDKQEVPVTTSLRALASLRAVSTAQQPVNANSGFGTSSWDWNMVQVGGQAVFNGQRIVKNSLAAYLDHVGGQAVFNGQRIVKSQAGEVVGKVVEP